MAGGFFDVRDDGDFFGILVRVVDSYKATRAKRVEELLLLVLGLAHLREWIAPNYKRRKKPKNSAEQFVSTLYENANYQIVLQLANHAKHQRRQALPEAQTSTHVEMMDDRDTPIDSWLDFDAGPASAYGYGDEDLLNVFEALIAFYRAGWFSLPLQQRLE